nr:MAG TPA: Protein of unknown function (DUF1043) [Caudoviricetes sp.]
MEDDEIFAGIPILIIGIVWGAFLMAILCTYRIGKVEEANKVLKIENHKLERKLLKHYDEQAEQTKKIAEMNGIGG